VLEIISLEKACCIKCSQIQGRSWDTRRCANVAAVLRGFPLTAIEICLDFLDSKKPRTITNEQMTKYIYIHYIYIHYIYIILSIYT
jgi:hypothetical protein